MPAHVMTQQAALEIILGHLEAIRAHITSINAHLAPATPAAHPMGIYEPLLRPAPAGSIVGRMQDHMAGEFCGHPSIGGGAYGIR